MRVLISSLFILGGCVTAAVAQQATKDTGTITKCNEPLFITDSKKLEAEEMYVCAVHEGQFVCITFADFAEVAGISASPPKGEGSVEL